MKQRSKVRRPTADKSASPPSASGRAAAATSPWTSPESLPRAAAIAFVIAACLVCLGYTLYTDQTWEDSLITLRHSENLLNGEGLTFNTGTRVHGFTSPINVLLLAICHFVTGKSSYVATFWVYRIFTISAFAASGVLLLKTIYETPPRWTVAVWFLGVVYLLDVKTIAFSINGMETGFVLLFLAWAVYLISRTEPEQWRLRGLCWAGLMWSRPDAFIYIAALSLGELIFLSTSRRATFTLLAKSAAVCALCYGPWIIWAWLYYGSPIPHTITAKGSAELGGSRLLLAAIHKFPGSLIDQAAHSFRPIYCGDAINWTGSVGWGLVTNSLTKLVGLIGLLYCLYPVSDRFGRAMSLAFAVLCSYLAYMPVQYPWYYPAATLLGLVTLTRAATMFAVSASERALAQPWFRRRKTWCLALLILLTVAAIVIFVPACLEERIQQAEIEMGNRAAIGKWLKENAAPTDTVYLEPLGYVGYFSGLHINDYPGLVSPDVVRIRRQLPNDLAVQSAARQHVIPQIKANWVVLRSSEYQQLSQLPIFAEFKNSYTLVREFNVNPILNRYSYVPGNMSLRFDAHFYIFRRNTSAQ